jgi:hypothetical protein
MTENTARMLRFLEADRGFFSAGRLASDVAGVFVRGDSGVPMVNPLLPWGIKMSRVLEAR